MCNVALVTCSRLLTTVDLIELQRGDASSNRCCWSSFALHAR